MKYLNNKTALICGASQGIGEACSRLFAKNGCRVILLSRSEEKLKKILDSLDNKNQHEYFSCDISNPEEYLPLVSNYLKKRSIDILINNSGGPKSGPIVSAETDEFMLSFKQHVIANHNLAKMILPGMKKSNYGRIINILSTSIKIPIQNLGVSNTIRSAVAAWAKTLSMEVGKHGITVNNILPGFTKTPRLKNLIDATAKKLDKSYEDIEELWKNNVPAKRFAEASETASAILFLASKNASYINGVSLPVDGGRTGSF
jgi:3-oxoacyl-[acyl-carrier protein] reductase